jgi:hypothetical protein
VNKENIIYIHAVGYCSDMKKNEVMSFAGKWVELESIMLSKRSQTEKDR